MNILIDEEKAIEIGNLLGEIPLKYSLPLLQLIQSLPTDEVKEEKK